jgi:hypothetical protein
LAALRSAAQSIAGVAITPHYLRRVRSTSSTAAITWLPSSRTRCTASV